MDGKRTLKDYGRKANNQSPFEQTKCPMLFKKTHHRMSVVKKRVVLSAYPVSFTTI